MMGIFFIIIKRSPSVFLNLIKKNFILKFLRYQVRSKSWRLKKSFSKKFMKDQGRKYGKAS